MKAIDPDDLDRVVKLVADADKTLTFDEAAALLRTYRVQAFADADACAHPAWQAAALTIVNAGMRAVHGGVRVTLAVDAPCALPWARGATLSTALAELGADVVVGEDAELEAGVPAIVL